MRKNAHCHYCGTFIKQEELFPYQCTNCHSFIYVNPIPVPVLLLPVDSGLLVVRRNIDPFKGQLALPGGFMDLHESWQEGAARELREETCIEINPDEIKLIELVTVPGILLIFGLAPKVSESALSVFKPNSETSEIAVIHEATDLAFTEHTRMARLFFEHYV